MPLTSAARHLRRLLYYLSYIILYTYISAGSRRQRRCIGFYASVIGSGRSPNSNSFGCGVCGAVAPRWCPWQSRQISRHASRRLRARATDAIHPFRLSDSNTSRRVESGLRARISFAEGHPRDFGRTSLSTRRSARHRQFILLCRRHAHAYSKVHTKATHVDGGSIERPTDRRRTGAGRPSRPVRPV